MSEAITIIQQIKNKIKEIDNDIDFILKNQKKKKGGTQNERERS
jgi:hypothetical protein